jgi:signal peptidase I
MSNDQQNFGVEDKQNLQAVSSPVSHRSSENRSLVIYTIIAVAIAVIVRIFVAAPYLVSGPSMEETFHNHDYLIIQKFSACVPFTTNCIIWGAPERGDIIVFHLPQNPSQTLIKRVIGLPGETVSVNGTEVTIKNDANPDGLTLSEPYISPQDAGGPTGETVTLGADQYFVMGDNRRVSYDSRSWGALPTEDIIGRVLIRLYPFTQIGLLPGEARYQ